MTRNERTPPDGSRGFIPSQDAVPVAHKRKARNGRVPGHLFVPRYGRRPKGTSTRSGWPDAAITAPERFAAKHAKEYPKAVACLIENREAPLAVYDVAAEH